MVDLHSNSAIRILIVCGETIIRESLQLALRTAGRFEVVGGCSDGEETLCLVRTLKPDVLLLDYNLPQDDCMHVLAQLANSNDKMSIVLLCSSITQEDTIRALHIGVRGIVLKTEPTDSLLDCIGRVVHGDYWLGKSGIKKLVHALFDLEDARGHPKHCFGLTPREIQMVEAVMEGYSNVEIAANFSLSQETVKHHLSHIFDKLGVYSRLELALFGVNHNIHSAPRYHLAPESRSPRV